MSDSKEQPLDPEVEKVRRRMMRLMIVSILIMLVGLIAVFAGVVYKINSEPDQETAPLAAQSANTSSSKSLYSGPSIVIDLPDGASVIDKQLEGTVLLVDVRLSDGKRQFFVVDLSTGKTATSISFD